MKVGTKFLKAKSELDYYFEDEIYNKVDFYVNSDGNYMGESGSVNIVLEEDDEEPYFSYDKSATSEWYEVHSTKLSFPVSEKTFRLFLDKISSLSGSYSNDFEINYKVDCIITLEEEILMKELVDVVCNEGGDWESRPMVSIVMILLIMSWKIGTYYPKKQKTPFISMLVKGITNTEILIKKNP